MVAIDSIRKERITPNDFIVLIEITKGSKMKYELDKETGYILLDRVLYTSTHYPANYGLIPRTLAADGDHLDVLVLCSEPIDTNCTVRCYPIGMIRPELSGRKNYRGAVRRPYLQQLQIHIRAAQPQGG